MSMYHFSDTEAVEHDVNTVPDFGDFERVEIDGQWYVPERTCHMVRDDLTDTTYCDVCGERFDQPWYLGAKPHGVDTLVYHVEYRDARYCPHCGAMVVDE